MVVYRLANQAAGIPLDDSRKAGRPEGLVEFAPANDTLFSDKLEKMVVAPPGITGQCFNPLDLHHVALSLHAGSLATASQSLSCPLSPQFGHADQTVIIGWTSLLCKPRLRRLADAWVMLGEGECGGEGTWPLPGAHA